MYYVKWTFWILFWGVIAAVLHYTLPQTDVVRVVATDESRVDFGANRWFYSNPGSGTANNVDSRDVFFIRTRKPNDGPIVYRNEDTGWGWPPYFKFDTGDLQTVAADLVSTSDAPRWVAVRHYGWDLNWLSVHPNAVSIRLVDGPDVRIVPWFNIVFLTLSGMAVWAIWARLRRFRERRIDPALEEVQEALRGIGR